MTRVVLEPYDVLSRLEARINDHVIDLMSSPPIPRSDDGVVMIQNIIKVIKAEQESQGNHFDVQIVYSEK
jgi:hypothetical protein